jgi:Fe-S cluster assembly protein SufD
MKQLILDFKNKLNEIEITEDTEILGAFAGKNNDIVDDILNITHKKPGIFSRIYIKAVVTDSSKFNLLGNLRILKEAIKTDSYLKIDVLILSKNASAKVIPSLEITENDVTAGHSATIGKINAEWLLYLKSKGLNQKQSEKLIIDGFLQEILSKIR